MCLRGLGGAFAHGLVLGRVTGKGGAPPIAQGKSVTRAGLVAGADRGSPHIGDSATIEVKDRRLDHLALRLADALADTIQLEERIPQT